MRLLLDTHILLGWVKEDRSLRSKLRTVIEDDANDVILSSVSAVEIAIKSSIGKLPGVSVAEVMDEPGMGHPDQHHDPTNTMTRPTP